MDFCLSFLITSSDDFRCFKTSNSIVLDPSFCTACILYPSLITIIGNGDAWIVRMYWLCVVYDWFYCYCTILTLGPVTRFWLWLVNLYLHVLPHVQSCYTPVKLQGVFFRAWYCLWKQGMRTMDVRTVGEGALYATSMYIETGAVLTENIHASGQKLTQM
jgi:hypothetical protein